MPKRSPKFQDTRLVAAVPVLLRAIEQRAGISIGEISDAMMVVTDARTRAGMVRNWHRWRVLGKKDPAIPSIRKLNGILRVARMKQWLPTDLPAAVMDLISMVEADRAPELRAARDRAIVRMEEHAAKAFDAYRFCLADPMEALEDTFEIWGRVLANLIVRYWEMEHSPRLGAELEAAIARGLEKAKAILQDEVEFRKTGDQKFDPTLPFYDPEFDEGESPPEGFPKLKGRSREARQRRPPETGISGDGEG